MTELQAAMKELLECGTGASVLIIHAEPAEEAATTQTGQQRKSSREHR